MNTIWNKPLTLLTVTLLGAVMAGCNSAPTRDKAYAPVEAAAIPPAPRGNGSIYQAGHELAWFEDIRARRVGDILVVNLVENTAGSSSTETTVDKSNSNTVNTPTLFGNSVNFTLPMLPGRSGTRTYDLSHNLSSEHSFSGTGDTDQSNQLNGTLSVMVTEVLPNGYLRIRGEKRIGLNSGNEYVRLSGIVRPMDIDTSNTVQSTRIADVTLSYVGDGPVANASKVGWIAKFFVSALMPF